MDTVKKQIYQNVIDSLCLADNYRTVEHLIPEKDDDTILEEMTHKLVSLLRKDKVQYKDVPNVGRFPVDYTTLNFD
ncbi:uncharacterized protein METZ01_LOCUS290212 [marine metagenome]|uniref:Uncharacterized protein n=1 Tax=marine metagenome TaxID=408172 RepID=A0A382LKQ5_9ZZZZ|tara:strand:+ start:788 stop:1015 length:228 start_codon:yes stop_codon:yes gene_type:complete